MAQTLLIGLGGTGSRVVNNVVRELNRNNQAINDGNICCAVLDTNVNDNESITNSNTGVPVIPTSKSQKIADYINEHNHLNMQEWCPVSPAFLRESMLDGASELRVKSRIAFMDTVETGAITQLEWMINDALKNNVGSKIRVMIVSSLSGGTGSGMFIQVALWLRKVLSESDISIRGIFLLPDVFVSTVKDIRENRTTQVRHYANAYAAIRELNALNKIKLKGSVKLTEEISLDRLFDSVKDNATGKGVYDLAFFVDDRDEKGTRLGSIAEYEKMVAQLIYMQLYAPMAGDMYSEEDNFFLSMDQSEEPLYGSCGTAKAIYDVESTKEYCALRAARGSLTTGWCKIDQEIDELEKIRKQEEEYGNYSDEEVKPREEYIRLFDDKASADPELIGKEGKLFIKLGKVVEEKAEGFVKSINEELIADAVNAVNEGKKSTEKNKYKDVKAFVDVTRDKDSIETIIRNARTFVSEENRNFEFELKSTAEKLVNQIFPYSMGEVNANNENSVYGMLTSCDSKGRRTFIHPIAARYVLYKLSSIIDAALEDSGDKGCSAKRIESLKANIDFDAGFAKVVDIESTQKQETTVEEYFKNKPLFRGMGKHIDDLEESFASFYNKKLANIERYEKAQLTHAVYSKLSERLQLLTDKMEYFFGCLEEVGKKLDKQLADNLSETALTAASKNIYVLGSEKDKEALYQKLKISTEDDSEINRSVIDSVYGSVCANKRSTFESNAPYLNLDLTTSFVEGIKKSYLNLIDRDADKKKAVEMDIYTAFEQQGEMTMIQLRDKLYSNAAPYLIHDKEVSKNALGTTTTRNKTFWGFHPDVNAAYPKLGQILGVNADLQADSAYSKSELYCYRAVYGLEMSAIPKFNELNGDIGNYYGCYNSIVNEMVKACDWIGEEALVQTPHLDKRWHKILPYVTKEKQEQAEKEFYRTFWLAIAYGMIKTDKEGNVCIKRKVGAMNTETPLLHGNRPIGKVNVLRILNALKTDKVFTNIDAVYLNERFEREVAEMTSYVGTDVLKGLTVKKEDFNPVNVLSRYTEAPNHTDYEANLLLESLEDIAKKLASGYNQDREEKDLIKAKYRICRKIYDSSSRSKGKSEIFSSWEDAFEEYRIKEETQE